jgi:serine/threonine protein kinase
MNLTTQSGRTISIEKTPFARGGEGEVYRIISPGIYSKNCIKLYYPKIIKDNLERQKMHKIQFMIRNAPVNWQNNNYILCWPLELVFNSGKFVGFMMPLAYSDSIEVSELCDLTYSVNIERKWKSKYDRYKVSGFNSRLKLCTNIASAIHNIHSLKNYTIVDLKPENILITNDGKVSIVDCDSLQISDQNRILYHAPVATLEYTPPEGLRLKIQPSKSKISQSWDRFSLAVIFYKIILGLHPYTATFGGQFQNVGDIPPKIENGLFVHGNNKHKIIALPPPHNTYQTLPDPIQNLFYQAFEEGNTNPGRRPSAELWGSTLYKVVTQGAISKRSTNKTTRSPRTTGNTKSVSKKPNYFAFGTATFLLFIVGLVYMGIIPTDYTNQRKATTSQNPISYNFKVMGLIEGAPNKPVKFGQYSLENKNFASVLMLGQTSSHGGFELGFKFKPPNGIYLLKVGDDFVYLLIDAHSKKVINVQGTYNQLKEYSYFISGSPSSKAFADFLKDTKNFTEEKLSSYIQSSNGLGAALITLFILPHERRYNKYRFSAKNSIERNFPDSPIKGDFDRALSKILTKKEPRLATCLVEDLRIREGNRLSSRTLGAIPKGANVNVINTGVSKDNIDGISAEWWEVEYNGIIGFCFSGYLMPDFYVENKPVIKLPSYSNLIGDGYNDYSLALQKVGIISQIKEKRYSTTLPPNTIVYFYYKGSMITKNHLIDGVNVSQGDTLEFVITSAVGSNVDLPNLTCLTYEQAKFWISASGLKIGILQKPSARNEEALFVTKQEPSFIKGKQIPLGSTVNLYLDFSPPTNCN